MGIPVRRPLGYRFRNRSGGRIGRMVGANGDARGAGEGTRGDSRGSALRNGMKLSPDPEETKARLKVEGLWKCSLE